MKKTIQNCCILVLLMLMPLSLMTSCVDENYDLSEIDTEIVILRDVTLPVGNLNPVSIADFLNVDNEESLMIRSEANGDMAFAYDADENISASFDVPTFDFEINEGAGAERTLSLTLPSVIAGMDVSLLEQYMPDYYNKNLSFKDITGKNASLTKSIEIEDDALLPYPIVDIKEADIDADITYEFSLAVKDKNGTNINSYGGAVYIAKGFTLDFPDWLMLKKNDSMDCYSIVTDGSNKNIVRFDKDFKITADQTVKFEILANKVEIPAGFIVDGGKDSEGRNCKKLTMDTSDPKNMVLVDGDFYVKASDFKKVPNVVEMNMHLSISTLSIKSALVSVNPDEELPDQSFKLPEVPEILRRSDVVIDIYDPVMKFDVKNESPLDVNVSGRLYAYRGDQELMNTYLGENGENTPLVIPHDFNGTIGYSRRGEDGMIANPFIGDLFRTLPDKVAIKNLKVTTGNDYVRITPGTHLECSVGYSFHAPLAFGPELALGFEYELDELGLDLQEVGITSARMAFDIVNTIPLALDLGVTALDADGNPSRDITVELDGNLGAGTLDAPSTSTVSLTLKSKGKGINLNGLRLDMQASCPTSHQGKVINRNQGIAIRNLKVSLPEGISLDLEELTGDLSNE